MKVMLLWVSAVVVVVECHGCPGHCLCYRWRGLSRTDCVRRNLFNTFLGFSHETQALDLSHNVISILHGNEFLDANLRELQMLSLANNRVHKIDKFSFNGLDQLQEVDLSFNSLEHLPPATFQHNLNLKVLNLSHNPLGLAKDDAFLYPAPSLRVLDLAHCLLQFLSVRSFFDLKELRVLNVSNNYVTGMHPDAFEGMPSLRVLDVSRNDFPCNDQSTDILRRLLNRGIQFRAFCQTNYKTVMVPGEETKETSLGDAEPYQEDTDRENVTRGEMREESTGSAIHRLFRSMPPFYAVLCGVHLGMLLGALSAYICLRKDLRAGANENRIGAATPTFVQRGPDNMTFALIPLSTPPGTPPSPYRSRLAFSSTFSLPAA